MLPRSPRGHHSGPTLIFMRAAEATTLPAVDPSDAEGEVVGEAASSETVRRLLRERVVCNEIARIHRVARRHGS